MSEKIKVIYVFQNRIIRNNIEADSYDAAVEILQKRADAKFAKIKFLHPPKPMNKCRCGSNAAFGYKNQWRCKEHKLEK